jgi:hypothetical protein
MGAAKLDYTDHMAGVLDDATLIGTPKGSAGVTVSGPTKGTLHITGQVAAGATATVTYKVKVKDYADQGNHHLGNFVTIRVRTRRQSVWRPTRCAPRIRRRSLPSTAVGCPTPVVRRWACSGSEGS